MLRPLACDFLLLSLKWMDLLNSKHASTSLLWPKFVSLSPEEGIISMTNKPFHDLSQRAFQGVLSAEILTLVFRYIAANKCLVYVWTLPQQLSRLLIFAIKTLPRTRSRGNFRKLKHLYLCVCSNSRADKLQVSWQEPDGMSELLSTARHQKDKWLYVTDVSGILNNWIWVAMKDKWGQR